MAPAILGLTPRWVMFLGAVLLLLLPGASAQEPPGMGKARGPRGRGGGGLLGPIQGGAQPAGLASSALTPSLGSGHRSHCWELTSCPEALKTSLVGTYA